MRYPVVWYHCMDHGSPCNWSSPGYIHCSPLVIISDQHPPICYYTSTVFHRKQRRPQFTLPKHKLSIPNFILGRKQSCDDEGLWCLRQKTRDILLRESSLTPLCFSRWRRFRLDWKGLCENQSPNFYCQNFSLLLYQGSLTTVPFQIHKFLPACSLSLPTKILGLKAENQISISVRFSFASKC